MSEVKYSKYVEEKCCEDCDYAGGYQSIARMPSRPISICPDCGGKLIKAVGRWLYTESKTSCWRQFFVGFGMPATTRLRFEKGRNPKPYTRKVHNHAPGHGSCDCPGCEISDSGNGYQPCHNRNKLIHPPQET